MIILLTFEEVNEKTKSKTGKLLVSHGYDTDTNTDITMPQTEVQHVGRYSAEIGEWILK